MHSFLYTRAQIDAAYRLEARHTDKHLHNNAPHRKCLRKTTTACVSLFVFFTIRRGTFPYSIKDDASTTSQTPTTHYTNTCVKLTIVTHLSFSERIAITKLSFSTCGVNMLPPWPSPLRHSHSCLSPTCTRSVFDGRFEFLRPSEARPQHTAKNCCCG